MPQIVQQGSINTTALVVPDLYVQIVPPQVTNLNGTPTNVCGVVGTASWGPTDQPAIVATMADYATAFGPIMPRKYDMGTQVATAVQQGASNFRCVRVTDGTDTAASVNVGTTDITFTARYTGSRGNQVTVAISPGSQRNTFRAVVAIPGSQPELFDNIAGAAGAAWAVSTAYKVGQAVQSGTNIYICVAAGTSASTGTGPTGTGAGITDGTVTWNFQNAANLFWLNLAQAINNGAGVTRGPSQIILATAGAGTTAPTTSTYALAGGTDGATTITAGTLVGVDTLPYTGMYALQGQGCGIALLADADDPTQWTTQAAFGLAQGIYMIATGPAGDTITNAISTKAQAGLDSYAVKLMFGDWIYWNDPTNNELRLVSPQGFTAGRLANLSPEQSSLNKQLFSVVGSQKSGVPGSGQSATYSAADLQTLFQAGIDVISNPQPGGSYWGVRCGHNSSSNAAINGDNYTRLTNYIAATLAAGMGVYVGQVINGTLFQNIAATLNSFLNALLGQGILGSLDGSLPFGVTCDTSNNPQSRTSLGYVQADTAIQYQGINEKFIVNMQGGQTVVIPQSTGQAIGTGA